MRVCRRNCRSWSTPRTATAATRTRRRKPRRAGPLPRTRRRRCLFAAFRRDVAGELPVVAQDFEPLRQIVAYPLFAPVDEPTVLAGKFQYLRFETPEFVTRSFT